jgi:hypothetical protein
VATITELSMMRAAGECGITDDMELAAQTVAPKHIAPQRT